MPTAEPEKITPEQLADLRAEARHRAEAALAEARARYYDLFRIEWRVSRYEPPEWYDHNLDLMLWPIHIGCQWAERGVFTNLALRPGGTLVDLACGDGWFARHVYARICGRIIGVDHCQSAIDRANGRHRLKGTEFICADILTWEWPDIPIDNVALDAAIEHLTKAEREVLIARIANALGDQGIFSGCTIRDDGTGHVCLSHHRDEFKTAQDVADFLRQWFRNVICFQTALPERANIYWWASQGAVPFGGSANG